MQASVPPVQPWVEQVPPPRAVPSQVSPALITLLPQLVHCAVTSWQVAEQVSVPPAKPCDAQVLPPSAMPSHCSPPSMTPLPQLLPAKQVG